MEKLSLIINNSYSQLTGLSIAQHKQLKTILSYKIPNNYYGSFRSNTRYLLGKDGTFATGLLKRVLTWLNSAKLYPQLVDHRKRPVGHPRASNSMYSPIWAFKPYKQQLAAVKIAASLHRGTLSMPTGSGKSITMALLINALQVRTLIVVPNLNLKHQLTETLAEIFGNTPNITVLNIDSAKLKSATNYDLLIVDEAHHAAASTYRKLNKTAWKNIYHRYFFTATPFRGQEEEQILMESVAGDVIYSLSYREAVDAKMILPLQAFYVEVPVATETAHNTWARVYKDLVVNNEARNEVIKQLMDSFRYAGASALCLVKEVAHGKKLTTSLIPFAHGDNEETQDLIKAFSKGPGCLYGTTGVVGEGTDTKACDFVVLAGLGKSKPALMQAFGRCLRTAPGKTTGTVIIFQDYSHKWTTAHYKAQVKVLKEEYGCIPVKLRVDSWE